MSEVIRVCPECGRDLTGVNPRAHSLEHYPEYLDPARSSKEARKMQALINAGGVTIDEYEKMKG